MVKAAPAAKADLVKSRRVGLGMEPPPASPLSAYAERGTGGEVEAERNYALTLGVCLAGLKSIANTTRITNAPSAGRIQMLRQSWPAGTAGPPWMTNWSTNFPDTADPTI